MVFAQYVTYMIYACIKICISYALHISIYLDSVSYNMFIYALGYTLGTKFISTCLRPSRHRVLTAWLVDGYLFKTFPCLCFSVLMCWGLLLHNCGVIFVFFGCSFCLILVPMRVFWQPWGAQGTPTGGTSKKWRIINLLATFWPPQGSLWKGFFGMFSELFFGVFFIYFPRCFMKVSHQRNHCFRISTWGSKTTVLGHLWVGLGAVGHNFCEMKW